MKKNHELGALIASIQERNGWSDRDLQQRAEALGLTALSKSNFSRWRTSPVNSIKGSNIRDMAAVLGIPEAVVAQAALESMGVTMQSAGDDSLDHAIALDVDLSARDKHVVRAVIDVLRNTEEMTGHGHAAPITHAGESPAADQERRERSIDSSSSDDVHRFTREHVSPAAEHDLLATPELSLVADEDEHPLTAASNDELGRRRREREAEEAAGQEVIPLPDEELMAGYDAPSEGRAMREAQDADAEGPQD